VFSRLALKISQPEGRKIFRPYFQGSSGILETDLPKQVPD
jgi:hypothetical protein